MSVDCAIRAATPDDLGALYEVARRALVHDQFSADLLAEKLFLMPRRDEFCWQTVLAERGGRVVGFAQGVFDRPGRKAWLGLFAVAPGWRRRGVAARLWRSLQQNWPAEPSEVEVLAIPGNYFAPGLDPRYTAALCWLERQGFERIGDCVNLTVALERGFETRAEQDRLAAVGVEVRRARRDDQPLLEAFFDQHFGRHWLFEAGQALPNEPPTLHLALRGGRIIGFAAHSTQNREWGFFGPMGTAPESRGLGVGRVLLWHCLNDLRRAGHRQALIPWVGPISFYHHWAGCVVQRVFWRYSLRGAAGAGT